MDSKIPTSQVLIDEICAIRIYQNKPSLANQGQCLDGFSALAAYNYIADKYMKFCSESSPLDLKTHKTKAKEQDEI